MVEAEGEAALVLKRELPGELGEKHRLCCDLLDVLTDVGGCSGPTGAKLGQVGLSEV